MAEGDDELDIRITECLTEFFDVEMRCNRGDNRVITVGTSAHCVEETQNKDLSGVIGQIDIVIFIS